MRELLITCVKTPGKLYCVWRESLYHFVGAVVEKQDIPLYFTEKLHFSYTLITQKGYLLEHTDDLYVRSTTYFTIGKVTYAQAQQGEHSQRTKLLEEASLLFEKALTHLRTTEAYTEMSAVYSSLAEVLEALGRPQKALEYWRSAYEALAHIQTS